MEQQYILTQAEADIISTIRNDDAATIYEITTAAQLTPSEVLEVLSRLRERNLVLLAEDQRQARLTDEGRHVRILMEQQEKYPFSSSHGEPKVVVLSGDEASAARQAFEGLELNELDQTLDSELERLEQEASAGQT